MKAMMLPIVALACGCLQPLQALVNGRAALAGVGVLWTGAMSAGTSMTVLAILASILLRRPFPSSDLLAAQGPTIMLGGLMGGVLVSGLAFAVPRMGPTRTFLLYFAAIALTSVAIDQFGLLGQPVKTLTLTRLGGAALVISGVVIVRLT